MKKTGFLGYVHSFRGFAILNIVAIHALALALVIPANWDADRTAPLFVLNETLFHDSTLYFALISGLLFSAVLRVRGYQRFYRNKLLYVWCPYLCCTVVFSVLRWNTEGTGVFTWPPGLSDYLGSIAPNLVRGEAQFTYWYIPVLFFLFAMTPLLSQLTRARPPVGVLAWAVMLLPLAFSRPEFEDGALQVTAGTLLYFTGAYTAGIYLGNDLEGRLDRIARYRSPLVVIVVAASLLLMLLQFAEINRFGSFSLQESVYYVQKMGIAALVLLWLRGLAAGQPRWLRFFASEAFSIYFLHVFFMLLLAEVFWDILLDPAYQPWSIYLAGPVYFAFALAMSVGVVHLLRRLLGKHSRLVIGS
jgi:surface polysaccharide O-acyltransferase-like enzyme